MKSILLTIITISILTAIILVSVDYPIETKSGNAAVLCDIAFMYDMSKPHSIKTVSELEELSKQCKSSARTTSHYYHTSGKYEDEPKHAVVAGGMCTINWQLTPKAHIEAYNHICLN